MKQKEEEHKWKKEKYKIYIPIKNIQGGRHIVIETNYVCECGERK